MWSDSYEVNEVKIPHFLYQLLVITMHTRVLCVATLIYVASEKTHSRTHISIIIKDMER
jgi:hypothetical protein